MTPFQNKYIRRFLCAINKAGIRISYIPFNYLSEDLGYKIIHYRDMIDSVTGTRFATLISQLITAVGMQYIVKSAYTITDSCNFIYTSKIKFIHAIIFPENIKCILHFNNQRIPILRSIHFQNSIPNGLLDVFSIDFIINYNSTLPINVIIYSSILPDESLNKDRIYYWHESKKAEPIHSWRIHNGKLIQPTISECIVACPCKDTQILKWNDLSEYHVKPSLLT